MAAMADVLIPASAVVLGGLITGGFTLGGQVLTHRGTHKRERDARHDTFMIQRYEIERDTLIALQDALCKHSTMYMHVARERPLAGENNPPTPFDLVEPLSKVTQLVARVLDDDARICTDRYARLAHDKLAEAMRLGAPTRLEDLALRDAVLLPVVAAYGETQEAVGAAIRRNPFTEKR